MFLGSSYVCQEYALNYLDSCLAVKFYDGSGNRTGFIESMFSSEQDYSRGDQCELIGISKASVGNKEASHQYQTVSEMDRVSEIKGLDLYKFYNVLWIEWNDGIAYRKALGMVWKEAWERQDLEEIDVVLG